MNRVTWSAVTSLILSASTPVAIAESGETAGTGAVSEGPAVPQENVRPIALKLGEHYFIDDTLVYRSNSVAKVVIKVADAKDKRDRSVARQSGARVGLLVTPWVTLDADEITLNCDASNGEIRVQVVDELDWMVYGLAFGDCKPIKTDSRNAPVKWDRPLSLVHGKKIRLQFSMRNASLYGFELKKAAKPN